MSSVPSALDDAIASLGMYANFEANITQGPPQLGVQFTSTSSGNPDTWEWDLDGDGTIDSYEENPFWLYDAVGSYDVSLTIYEGTESNTLTEDDFITVTDPSNIYGNVAGTWTSAYSPYVITGTTTIQPGCLLNIEPNTEIIVNGNSKLEVKGQIIAQGSERGLIEFSTNDQWKGIKIIDSSEDNVIDYCYFTGATESAVEIENSSAEILNSIFYENSNTSQKGPAINVIETNDVLISGNSISNNTSSILSGGIVLDNSSCTISHNIIVNNEAMFAGAIGMKNGSDAALVNNTIANNIGNYACIYLLSSSPIVNNCILIHDGLIFTTFSSSPTVTYSCVTGGYTGTGNISDDPLFLDPTTGDGPTYDGLAADWSLQDTSPCIDTGDPASPPDPDGTRADMGALYYHHQISVDDPYIETIYISQNSPNPFKGSTAISYSLPKNCTHATLTIYNIIGDKVNEFTLDDTQGTIVWNGLNSSEKPVASGIYFYRLQGDSISQTRKMVYMK
ncbi:MAG TPA: T9SS type A sorting domain-containing protein [Candidatus Cloacimonetes bacterium]|nr:T9SS type A sorting domain-containing protein [Candidatus Cloacimonadota bacterium]HEX37319.1 T9SS type A sorting domain-containing protein [Candidatus Cloacimonadota bacterium]